MKSTISFTTRLYIQKRLKFTWHLLITEDWERELKGSCVNSRVVIHKHQQKISWKEILFLNIEYRIDMIKCTGEGKYTISFEFEKMLIFHYTEMLNRWFKFDVFPIIFLINGGKTISKPERVNKMRKTTNIYWEKNSSSFIDKIIGNYTNTNNTTHACWKYWYIKIFIIAFGKIVTSYRLVN